MQMLVEQLTAESKPLTLRASGNAESMELAQSTVNAGGWSLLHYRYQAAMRWALVSGVECKANAPHPHALLLLDPQASEPWGTGYNARLFITTPADSHHGTASLWRDVWGGCAEVDVLGLLSVVPRS
jgi:hypothetical protein